MKKAAVLASRSTWATDVILPAADVVPRILRRGNSGVGRSQSVVDARSVCSYT